MGDMDWVRTEVEHFFVKVTTELGLSDWTLRWQEHDAYCWRSRKLIDIRLMDSELECKQLVLHEIAHIEEDSDSNNKHTRAFFDRLEELCLQFMGMGLSLHQLRFKGFYIGTSILERSCE